MNRKRYLGINTYIILIVASLLFSTAAHSIPSLSEGLDWELPGYAITSENGAMLGIGTESDVALKGTFIEVPWRLVETTSGDYSWQDFDAKIAASAGNVLVRLEVNSICHAPDWVTIPYLDNKSLQFWKPEYVSQLTNFINAFGARYRAEDKIVGVHLGIADGEYYESGTQSGCPPNDKFDVLVNGFGRQGWGEFWLDESLGEETKSRQNGLTDVLLQSSVEDIIDMYVDAFGPYAYKLAMVNLDSFGTAADFEAKMPGIVNYALSKGIGNRGGEIEAWMRYTDNFYGVDLVDTPSPDGSCKMIFDESFADSLSLSGRYWGDENEFYGPEPWIIAQNGPIENQTYRFFVSSMRALQMRRNYVSTRKPGLDYLRGQNDEYRSAEFIDYLTKVFGRTRFDTPDAFVLLGERTLSTFSGLYPNEYKSSNTSESCLIQGEARGVTTVNQFGRWLSLKSSSVRDTSMSKDLTGWTQIINGQPYELYARKSNKMDFDINDQLIQARCSSGCDIEVKVSFKDDRPMTLVVNHSGGSETLTTQGGGFTRTATFPISGSFTNSLGANQHDFNVETTDGSDLSVIMVRVNFMSNQVNATPAIPMTVSPSGDVSEGDVVFTWKPVAGATEYKVSFNNAGNYDAGIYKSAVELNCSTGICRQTIQGFVPGSSSWWVRSRNTTGESGWSTTSNFTVIQLQAPTTPTALSPNGTTTAGNVTFSWNPVLGATEYNVSYNNAGNYDPGTYKSASALGCSSGTCRYTEYGLVAGSSTWWVRAKNTLGETGWSNTGNFTVSSPSAPTVIGPDNVNTGGNVTFTWYPTEGAIEYNVIYSNAGNNIDVGYKDANDLDCASRTCRLSVFGLAAGASSWKVRAKSTAGESDWTDTKTFTVTVPSAPTTIGPDNATAGGDVEFTWYPTFGATEYSVSYNNAGNYVVTDYKSAIEMDCSSGYCRYIATNLAAGSTDWWVKARSSAGESGWADTKTFTVAIPSTPTIIGPNNINTGNYVTFSWYPTAGAYEYNVSYNNAGTYTPGVYGGANDYNCSSGICSYTVGPLLEGNSTWWIRAKNSIGESSWSDTTSFIAGPPISPTAISPINTTAGSNVTFNWYPVAGAMEYIVSFNNAGSYNPGSYKTANELGCSSGQCSLSLGGLEAGSTDWWIRAKNSYGESGWSNTKTFVSSGQ